MAGITYLMCLVTYQLIAQMLKGVLFLSFSFSTSSLLGSIWIGRTYQRTNDSEINDRIKQDIQQGLIKNNYDKENQDLSHSLVRWSDR